MNTKEIVVISGKGGTGKTSLMASLVPFFEDAVIADCDVDAPDLKILFEGENIEEKEFIGLKRAFINQDKCSRCGLCRDHCKFKAINDELEVEMESCEGCGVCEYICPNNAIQMNDSVVGKVNVSNTKYGKLIHGRLIPGEETSGKLVAQVRKKAKEIAKNENLKYILIDGSPGIGCNVISSMTGVDKAIIVIEPTLSGLHDLEKIYNLTQKFDIPVSVVLNKSDLSVNGNKGIKDYCNNYDLNIDLEVPFNPNMVKAIVNKEIPSIYDPLFFDEIKFGRFIENLKNL